jgi:hypothetical protein
MNVVEQFSAVMPDVFEDTGTVRYVGEAFPSDIIPEGQRDHTLARIAGSMRRKGLPVEAIAAALTVVNERQCRPPLPSRDVQRIAQSISRYQPADDTPVAALEFLTIRELAARVVARGPRRYWLKGLWPSGDYGVYAGEMKTQKTWTTTDAVVSTASATPFLGYVAVDTPGPVLMFVGEGGEANVLRRGRAIADARGVELNDLPIHICARAPHLNNGAHLDLIRARSTMCGLC